MNQRTPYVRFQIEGNVLSPSEYEGIVMDIVKSNFPDRKFVIKENRVAPKPSNEKSLAGLVEVVGVDAPSIAKLTAKMYLVIGS